MQTIAITGASGFIGRKLVTELTRWGEYEVRVLSRDPQRDLLSGVYPEATRIVEGDLHDAASIARLLEPGCTVVNLAYLRSAGELENLRATENLLKACRKRSIGRLIHCSTADVVGRVNASRITEETTCNPVTGYGITKLKIEGAVAEAAAHNEFDVAIIRPTAVFGAEGEQLKKLVNDLRQGNPWLNYLKSCLLGKRRMNLIHISNVIAAIIFLIRQKQKIGGELYFVSDDDDSDNNFAHVEAFLMAALNIDRYPLPRFTLPAWLLAPLLAVRGRNDIDPQCTYDPGKLIGLGYQRPVSLEAGLAEYAACLQSMQTARTGTPAP